MHCKMVNPDDERGTCQGTETQRSRKLHFCFAAASCSASQPLLAPVCSLSSSLLCSFPPLSELEFDLNADAEDEIEYIPRRIALNGVNYPAWMTDR